MKKVKFFSILFFVAFVFLLRESSAHLTPRNYYPESFAELDQAPDEIVIRYSEGVEEKTSTIEVFGPNGERIDTNVGRVDELDTHFFRISLKDVGDGIYTVSWKAVSADDGHFSKGTYVFSVRQEDPNFIGAVSVVQLQHVTTFPEAFTIALELLGQSILIGIIIVFIFIWQPLRKKYFPTQLRNFDGDFRKKFSQLTTIGISLIMIGAFFLILIKTLDLQQIKTNNFFGTLMAFLTTFGGRNALYRILLASALMVFFIHAKDIFLTKFDKSSKKVNLYFLKITIGEFIFLLIFLMMGFSRARVSLAAASPTLAIPSVFLTFVHLFFKELWIGVLIAVVFILFPIMAKAKKFGLYSLSSFLLSKILSIAIAFTSVTAIYITWLHLKDFSNLNSTEWGSRFFFLLLIGIIFLALRLYNQIKVDKKLRNLKGYSNLGTVIFLESLFGIALIFLTSYLIITTPPYTVESFSFEQKNINQDLEIKLSQHPFEIENFLITIVDEKEKFFVHLDEVNVILENKAKSIGPIALSAVKRSNKGYIFSKDFLSNGVWNIKIKAKKPNGVNAEVSFTLDYPNDIDKIPSNHRNLFFTLILAFVGVLFVILSIFLYGISKKNKKIFESNFLTIENYSIKPKFVISIIIFICILVIVSILFNSFFKSDFRKTCEDNNHFWIQSVPMRNGIALSPDTVTGCTLDVGLFHFADFDEYKFFRKKTSSFGKLIKEDQIISGHPTELVFELVDSEENPIRELTVEHDKILHTLIVSENLEEFRHVHSEDQFEITKDFKKNSRYPVKNIFPSSGLYTILIDYAINDQMFTDQFFVNVVGENKMKFEDVVVPNNYLNQWKKFDGYDVKFSSNEKKLKAGEQVRFVYQISKRGLPVRNLEPYLAATMHVSVIKDNLRSFMHTNGEIYLPGSAYFQKFTKNYINYHSHFVANQFGPNVEVPITFPKKGIYKIFGEFKHEGKVVITDFFVKVE